jgi:alkanesulfonate monooxygenase SsuD/methylene tetrahydromethanopterin reductase-like flavin-dependent oxidoreductase (luciferase family)
MQFGAHLPLISFQAEHKSLEALRGFARQARASGYTTLCSNDHFVFGRPWIDGPTALACVLDLCGDMELATTVALPVVRGPVATAKALGAIDILSGGKLIAGVGPGSSQRDYEAVGVPFDERWKRLDEAVLALRALWAPDSEPFHGTYYSTTGISLEPRPAQQGGPPIWIGSWGSQAGLRRVVRLGDGWLSSGYNTTPERFRDGLRSLRKQLDEVGRPADSFPNGVATMWTYVTENRREQERIFEDVLGPLLNRPMEQLRAVLPVGSAEECAEKMRAFAEAGAERVFIWPLEDEVNQLETFASQVVPLVNS